MGQTVKEAKITTKAARSKLDIAKNPYWRAIDQGAHIGYRKNKSGGTWTARLRVPDPKSPRGWSYKPKRIGSADDNLDADGLEVLDYSQALRVAREWCEEELGGRAEEEAEPYLVSDAIRDYLEAYDKRGGKAHYEVDRRARIDILPQLGGKLVSDLTTKELRNWLNKLASTPPRRRGKKGMPPTLGEMPTDPEGIRQRRVSANKVLTILKAALNHAFNDGLVPSDDAWRRVKPFEKVDSAKVRYINEAEAKRLINTCDPDFRKLVHAALFTGCRYGELIATEVSDYNADGGTLHLRFTKSGHPRHVPITEEGQRFFQQLIAGRVVGEKMFLRGDGKPWGKSHQKRRLFEACGRAKIEPAISFHILRHTYGSWLAMKGVPLQVIAVALGHADTRITHKHYAALAPNYVADTVRANLPTLGISNDRNVIPIESKA